MRAFFDGRLRAGLIHSLILVIVVAVVVSPVGVQAQSPESYYSKAVGKYIEGNYKASFKLLQKVLDKDPDNASAKRLLPEVKKELPKSFLRQFRRKDKKTSGLSTQQQSRTSASDASDTGQPAGKREEDRKEKTPPDTAASSADGTGADTTYPEFQPVEAAERGGSLTPPTLSASPTNVIRHVNKDYTREKGREKVVYGIVGREYEDRIRFTIKSTGPVSYIGSRIFNPPMIIVDLPNTVDKLPDSPLPFEMGKVIRARHSQYRMDPVRTTRLVLDLEKWNDRYRLYRAPDQPGVVLDVFKKDAKLPPETPMVHRVDQIPSPATVSSATANLEKIQGDGQDVQLLSEAPRKLSLRLTNASGEAISGETVVYSFVRGSGTIKAQNASLPDNSRTLTDDGGFARATFKADTGAGITVVKAAVPSRNLSVKFRLDVQPGEARRLVKVAGDRQATLYGSSVPQPLVVEARDRYGNPVPGVKLKFKDLTGKGLLDLSTDTEGLQIRGTTNQRGRLTLDHYRIASDVEKNRVRVTSYRRPDDSLRTTFLVYGQPQLITIDFKAANLQDVLRTLAQVANWNIALAEETQRGALSEMSVTVHLEKVTALRALDTILDVKGLSRVSDGNVMKIVSKNKAIRKGVSVISPEELADYPANNIVTVAFKLRFLQANSQLAQQLKASLLAENSSIVADPSSNSLIVTDLANNLRRLKRIIRTIDRQDQLFDVRVFQLEQRNPEEIATAIKSLVPTGQGNVVPHTATNSLLVYADPNLMNRIKSLVSTLDSKNALVNSITVIDVEGYDAEALAQRINTVLGANVIPLDQLSNVDFDLGEDATMEDLKSLLSSSNEVDIGKLLNSAKVIALSNMEKIIVLGPKEIRQTAKLLVDKMKRKPGKYIENRSWDWVTFKVLPFEKARSLIKKTGGIKIQTEIEQLNAFLLSSKDKEELKRVKQFARKIESKYEKGSPVGMYKFKHLQFTTEDDREEFRESLESLLEGVLPQGNYGFVIDGWYHGVSYSTKRENMPDMRAAIASLDTSVYEHSSGEIMTYSPNYKGVVQVANFISLQDLGVVIAPLIEEEGGGGGGGSTEITMDHVVFVPKEEKQFVLKRLKQFDSTGRKTYTYLLKHMNSNDNNAEEMKEIANELGINVSFTNDAESNKVYFTTTPDNRDDVRSLLEAFDEPGVSKERVVLNFTPSYVSPSDLVSPIDAQNLGQVIYTGQNKVSLLVAKDRRDQIRKILKKIDDPSQSFQVIHLKRRQASDALISNLQSVLNDLGVNAQLAADPKTNSILYAAPKSREDQVAKVIKRLDRWQKQVLIKAVLVEIRLDEGKRLNPQWIANPGQARSPFVNENQFSAQDSLGLGYSLGAQGGDGGLSALLEAGDFLTVMRWIRENDESDIVTRPVVTALNNQQASIDLSQQRFYQTPVFDDEGNITQTQFTAQSADKTLTVTPTITKNSNIIMDVQIANDVFGNRPGPGAPFPINRRVTNNQVMVNDGQTIVLGGFIQTNQTNNVQRVPYISNLPVVGNLFKSTTSSKTRSELVIFLTPHVMETPGDITEGTDRTLEDMDEVAPEGLSRSRRRTNRQSGKTAGRGERSDTETIDVNSGAITAGQRPNLNTVKASDLRDQVGNWFANQVTAARKETYFTGWADLQSRLSLTNQEITKLQDVYGLSVPVINLNQASEEKLTRLPGMTSDLATNIVNYRFRNGNFRSLEGLYQVFGIDEQTYRRLEPFLTVK